MIGTIVSIAARLFKLLIISREGWEAATPTVEPLVSDHSKRRQESDLTIGEKFVETLYSIGRTSKNQKTSHPSPVPSIQC